MALTFVFSQGERFFQLQATFGYGFLDQGHGRNPYYVRRTLIKRINRSSPGLVDNGNIV